MIYFPWITHTYTLLWASYEPVANAPWGGSTGPHIPSPPYPIRLNVPLPLYWSVPSHP